MREVKGTGWVPERRTRRAAGRVGTVARRLGSLLLPERGGIAREPWILDQHATNACTGHNGAQLIYGLSGDKCSPWMPWTYGRLRDGATVDTLANVGVRTSAMLAAFRRHGSCAWQDWRPGAPGFGYDAIPPAVLRMQAQRRNLDVVAFYARGQALVELIVDALARGYPCGLVVRVDRRFENAGDSVVGPEDGANRGLHIITPWSFERVAGNYVISCVNSWSRAHADSGVVHLSAERAGQAPFACAARRVS